MMSQLKSQNTSCGVIQFSPHIPLQPKIGTMFSGALPVKRMSHVSPRRADSRSLECSGVLFIILSNPTLKSLISSISANGSITFNHPFHPFFPLWGYPQQERLSPLSASPQST